MRSGHIFRCFGRKEGIVEAERHDRGSKVATSIIALARSTAALDPSFNVSEHSNPAHPHSTVSTAGERARYSKTNNMRDQPCT